MNERFYVRRVVRQRVLPWPSCKRRLPLSIHTVTCIAGRAHCGHPADERLWVGQGTVLRAGAAFVPDTASALLGLAGLCWVAAFGLLCWHIAPVLWRVRPDGLWGCQG